MTARVLAVTARSAASRSIWKNSGSTSTKTGVAPARIAAVAEPTKVMSGIRTSSPSPMPSAIIAIDRASVPFGAKTPNGAPVSASSSREKASVSAPSVSQPLSTTCDTASRSASPSQGFTCGMSGLRSPCIALPSDTRPLAARQGQALHRSPPCHRDDGPQTLEND